MIVCKIVVKEQIFLRSNNNFDVYKSKPISRILLEFLGNVFFAYCVIVSVMLILFASVTIECEVNGSSMYPTLNNNYGSKKNDVVFVNMYDKDLDYEDIVVVNTDSEKIIKRLIGLAGDKINIVRIDSEESGNSKYCLERNGKIIEENYINIKISPSTPAISENGMDKTFEQFEELRKTKAENFEGIDEEGNGTGAFVVPDNSIFVLGDNRAVSRDSTSYGAFSLDKLVGKVEHIKKYDESNFHFYYYYILEGKFFQTIANCL